MVRSDKESLNEFYIKGSVFGIDVENKSNKNNKTYINGSICIQSNFNYYIRVNSYKHKIITMLNNMRDGNIQCLKIKVDRKSYVGKDGIQKIFDTGLVLDDIMTIEEREIQEHQENEKYFSGEEIEYDEEEGFIEGLIVNIEPSEGKICGNTHRVDMVIRVYNSKTRKYDDYQLIDNIYIKKDVADRMIQDGLIGKPVIIHGSISLGDLCKYTKSSRHFGKGFARPHKKKIKTLCYIEVDSWDILESEDQKMTKEDIEKIKNIIFSKYKVNILKDDEYNKV